MEFAITFKGDIDPKRTVALVPAGGAGGLHLCLVF